MPIKEKKSKKASINNLAYQILMSSRMEGLTASQTQLRQQSSNSIKIGNTQGTSNCRMPRNLLRKGSRSPCHTYLAGCNRKNHSKYSKPRASSACLMKRSRECDIIQIPYPPGIQVYDVMPTPDQIRSDIRESQRSTQRR